MLFFNANMQIKTHYFETAMFVHHPFVGQFLSQHVFFLNRRIDLGQIQTNSSLRLRDWEASNFILKYSLSAWLQVPVIFNVHEFVPYIYIAKM